MKINWFLIFIIIYLTGCKKPTRQYYYIMEEAKKYAVFQKGSYWIYQKDSSLITDSVYVDALEKGFKNRERDGEIIESSEYINCVTKSSIYNNFQITYKLQAQNNVRSMCNYDFIYDNDPNNTSWSIGALLHKIKNEIVFEQGWPTYLPTDSTYQSISDPINNPFAINWTWFDYPYDSVYECSIRNIPGASSQKNIWLAYTNVVKNVGILYWNVLYRDTSTVSWKLLRLHIVL